MQLAEIVAEFETARRLPRAALAAATAQPDALAPRVIACLRRAAAGAMLLPREERLLFYGIHALAAARHPAACGPWLALLRGDPRILDRIFGDAIGQAGPGLMIGLFDGDADALFAALADPAADGAARWALFDALAWLAWKGSVPRAAAGEFLARFHARSLAPPGDAAWRGWEDAVILLGLAGLHDAAIARARQDETLREVDIAGIAAGLAEVAERPDDEDRFIGVGAAPFDDPADALGWMRPAPPPIRGALDPDDLAWLHAFLASDEAPSLAMSGEELDGFMTGLAVLPRPPPPQDFIPLFWGGSAADGPALEEPEKLALIDSVLALYPAHVARELAGTGPVHAAIDPPADGAGAVPGMAWAQGFLRAVALHRPSWTRLTADPRHRDAAGLIARMAEGPLPEAATASPGVTNSKTARLLGTAARTAYLALRNLPVPTADGPARSSKIGRNDPCPCGSGRKYKKCCGA